MMRPAERSGSPTGSAVQRVTSGASSSWPGAWRDAVPPARFGPAVTRPASWRASAAAVRCRRHRTARTSAMIPVSSSIRSFAAWMSLHRRGRVAGHEGRQHRSRRRRSASRRNGAYGGFFIPKSYGSSIADRWSRGRAVRLHRLLLPCIAMTWWYYSRRNAEMPVLTN